MDQFNQFCSITGDMYVYTIHSESTTVFKIRPCFVDSLFPVTHPHPLQATTSEIIIELTCYESH